MPGKQFRCRGDPWSGFAILAASFVIPFRARGREGRRGKGEGGWISERGGEGSMRLQQNFTEVGPLAFFVAVHPARTSANPTVWLRKKSFGSKSRITRPITRPAALSARGTSRTWCVRYYIASNPCPFPKPSMFIVPILSSENRNPSSILSAIDLARCIFLVLLSRTARYPCRETVLSLSYL